MEPQEFQFVLPNYNSVSDLVLMNPRHPSQGPRESEWEQRNKHCSGLLSKFVITSPEVLGSGSQMWNGQSSMGVL